MNTRVRAAAVIVTLTLALAGCGSEDGSDDTGAADSSPSTTTDAAGSPATVTSVSVQRSGGKTGATVRRTFDAGQPAPEGFTDGQLSQVIARAQTLVDTTPKAPEPPSNTCCDRFVYTVVIGLSDGSSTTYTAVDGAKTDPAFQALLNQVS